MEYIFVAKRILRIIKIYLKKFYRKFISFCKDVLLIFAVIMILWLIVMKIGGWF